MDEREIGPFASRTLKALMEEIRKTKEPYKRLLLKARSAALLAHSSDISEARKIIAEIRVANENYEPRLSAWVMYCDGIVLHSADFDNRGALDRFRRANIFGGAVRDAELAGSSAAWMAQCYFALGEVERTIEYLIAAFEWAHPNQLGALARASAVMADALAWTGDEVIARPWYNRARQYASSFGDIAMQNSVIYNSAAFRVSNATLAECENNLQKMNRQLAEAEANSATTLNTLIGNSNNRELILVLKAEAMCLVGNWKAADEALKEYFSSPDIRDLMRYEAKLLAQWAYCQSMQSRFDEARATAATAINGISDCKDLDDIAIAHHRLSQFYEMVGDQGNQTRHLEASRFALGEFRSIQVKSRSELQRVIDKYTALQQQ